MSNSHSLNRERQGRPSAQMIREALAALRVLLVDALSAGKYLPPGANWQPYANGEVLEFEDTSAGERRPGQLVLAYELTPAIARASVAAPPRSQILLAGWLDPSVELGQVRAARNRRMYGLDHYWAAYVIEDSVLVSSGPPPSSCRLIGEIINLQMPTPFVPCRICSNCHTLNTYYCTNCSACGHPLAQTGSLQ